MPRVVLRGRRVSSTCRKASGVEDGGKDPVGFGAESRDLDGDADFPHDERSRHGFPGGAGISDGGTLEALPLDKAVVGTEVLESVKVRPQAGVLANHGVDVSLQEFEELSEPAKPSIGQNQVAVPQLVHLQAESESLAPPKGSVSEIEEGTGRQRKQSHNPDDREAASGLLPMRLGIGGLVVGSVGELHGGAINDLDVAPVPLPLCRGYVLQVFSDLSVDVPQPRVGKTLACLAKARRAGGSRRRLSGVENRQPGQGLSDGLPARPVGRQNLGQEQPEGSLQGEQAVAKNALGQRPKRHARLKQANQFTQREISKPSDVRGQTATRTWGSHGSVSLPGIRVDTVRRHTCC